MLLGYHVAKPGACMHAILRTLVHACMHAPRKRVPMGGGHLGITARASYAGALSGDPRSFSPSFSFAYELGGGTAIWAGERFDLRHKFRVSRGLAIEVLPPLDVRQVQGILGLGMGEAGILHARAYSATMVVSFSCNGMQVQLQRACSPCRAPRTGFAWRVHGGTIDKAGGRGNVAPCT